MTAAPLLCVSCGYALAGLADDGVCPECATSVAQSVAARRGWFPSPEHLAVARRCLTIMLWCVILYALFSASRFLSILLPDPSLAVLLQSAPYAAALGWHIAFYVLVGRDPTLESGASLPRRSRVIRACAVLCVPITLFNLAMVVGVSWTGGPGAFGASFWAATHLVTTALPGALFCVQIAAGARLLARCQTPTHRRTLRSFRPDRPGLRWTAIVAIAVTGAQAALSLWLAWVLTPNTLTTGAPPPGIRPLFVFVAGLSLAQFALMLGILVQLLAALSAANSGVKRALEDAQLQTVIEAELATRRNL